MKKIICFLLTAVLALATCVAASFAKEGDENLALGIEPVCESESGDIPSLEVLIFSHLYLTDGVKDIVWDEEDQGMEVCWYASAAERETDITIMLDLESVCEISEIRIYPAGFVSGTNMPSDYDIEVSMDDVNYKVVASEKGVEGSHTDPTVPFVYEINEEAAYVRLHITKMSSLSDQSSYYAGLGELEVMGTRKPAPPTGVPTEKPEETDSAGDPEETSEETPAQSEAPKSDGEDRQSGNNAPKDSDKKGCGSSIAGISAVTLAVAAAACAAGTRKKKG
ncbi:MAG: discoidin domain-containing protein [Clostridia bacterium]|nr:discoidin domain-containing protein [Clostridia bacterium]